MHEDAKVIFGPAARPLPQLQIAVDREGYFFARGDYIRAGRPELLGAPMSRRDAENAPSSDARR